MKASDVRKQWKEVLDRAAQGELIEFERGGIIFNLGMKPPMLKAPANHYSKNIIENTDGTISPRDPKEKSYFETHIANEPFPDKPVCKIHGAPLDDRGRCMQKGCKYS